MLRSSSWGGGRDEAHKAGGGPQGGETHDAWYDEAHRPAGGITEWRVGRATWMGDDSTEYLRPFHPGRLACAVEANVSDFHGFGRPVARFGKNLVGRITLWLRSCEKTVTHGGLISESIQLRHAN